MVCLCLLSLPFQAQRLSRDYNVDILVNQVGYMPGAEKVCLIKGECGAPFNVIDIETQAVILSGNWTPFSGDFGTWSKGDFSAVSRPGHYYIQCDTLRSYPFEINSSVYHPAIDLIVSYFSRQRCGPSPTGYLSPCHLDDGIRMDNGKHQNVSGGWHDASDLRKWVGATIYGMIGLAKAYETGVGDRAKILDELLWGNRYFLHMQEPDGHIMSYIGGDVQKHSDSNRWTDNIIGEETGELQMVKPNAGRSPHDMLIRGTKDDRIIRTDPLDLTGQFNFITAEAMTARVVKRTDRAYARRCLKAAEDCFSWCLKNDTPYETGELGAAMLASLELYKTTKRPLYRDFAALQAKILRTRQAETGTLKGFYFTRQTKTEPYANIWNGCQALIALCDMVEAFPKHEEAPMWKDMIDGYARQYVQTLAEKNAFGMVPFGLYAGDDPGGGRRIGEYWYRYFMQPELDWWVGVNANLASHGIGLLKAADVLGDKDLKALAQRQLDWIIGSNPFNSSTVVGIGYGHPKHFPGSSFSPLTPVIPGAVLNGLGGNHDDEPVIGNGDWQISEYWTPMVAYTLWLMGELSE
ncbi:MAG TPA: glycoside hydrolase family 9 protein [Flavilitoribacter sp.]|nr:glycoside hydrolase family 9 protein [Flavilitoribacter sp.]